MSKKSRRYYLQIKYREDEQVKEITKIFSGDNAQREAFEAASDIIDEAMQKKLISVKVDALDG